MVYHIPWEALIGGFMLGISALSLLIINGKIAGISGIFSGLLSSQTPDKAWRIVFIISMVIAGSGVAFLNSGFPDYSLSGAGITPFIAMAAGLLVGIGTKLANGCTSGHGICGMGRFSRRSLVATSTFMAAAAITVFLRLHVLGG
ncbi:YeeE/YedE family protein [Enterovibrio baiacu]|uniref:YeeE/YedE family protein n=1 Tax=Enterovibrio baiacu TaxID=2491023 RepID=UPI001012C3D6|nr:YeeE/YedE thiosulfate transporter family protein [Enterovibrio baiacu]MBE1276669.1 YeeE/YedE family protein [Enterovibrio baiacu]